MQSLILNWYTYSSAEEEIWNRIFHDVVYVIKLFLEEIQISSKVRNWKKFVLVYEPAQKCEKNATFKQNILLLFKLPLVAVQV